MTLGDALDRAFGGPEHFTSQHCDRGHHQVCMRVYGGRSCECDCHRPRPKRIQLHRTKGWRKPATAIIVARPSKWGNPFLIGSNRPDVFVHDGTRVLWRTARDDGAQARAHQNATDAYRGWLMFSDDPRAKWIRAHLDVLRGRDLACWCAPDLACHADVLLDFANR